VSLCVFSAALQRAQNKEFAVFTAELVGIAVPSAGNYTRKETDALIEWVNVHK
jgi:aspartyl-tRNA synthetase